MALRVLKQRCSSRSGAVALGRLEYGRQIIELKDICARAPARRWIWHDFCQYPMDGKE
jgi:hypothetical protein